MKEGILKATIPAKGMVSFAVEGLDVFTRFQKKIYSEEVSKLTDKSYLETDTPFGKVSGMIISMGANLSHAYFWLEAGVKVLKKATLFYKTDHEWISVEDDRFPYEYSVPVPDNLEKVEFRLEGLTVDDREVKSGIFTLNSGK
jgi:hypothetical protein